jgi:hypothetical protein
MIIKLSENPNQDGHSSDILSQKSLMEWMDEMGGTLISSIKRVIAIAKTPSQNVSKRALGFSAGI